MRRLIARIRHALRRRQPACPHGCDNPGGPDCQPTTDTPETTP